PRNPLQRAAVQNAGTLQVDAGAVQQVGGIDPNGTAGNVTVLDGGSLTADHINQTSLVIGNGSVFTLAPSASDGSPMLDSGAVGDSLALAGSLAPSSSFVATSGNLLGIGSTSSTPSVSLA